MGVEQVVVSRNIFFHATGYTGMCARDMLSGVSTCGPLAESTT
jgi:hypothetical protein